MLWLLLVLVALAAGCGFGEGEEQSGGAQVRVTRDFGRTLVGAAREPTIREDQTVMRLLRSRFDVETRYGGRFVQTIDGLEGRGSGGTVDWFYFVNGVEADVGAAEYELSPGDRVQWDYRRWDAAMRVPAIVGAFPEPFLNGLQGKRRPVRVECEEDEAVGLRRGQGAPEAGGGVHLGVVARGARHRDRDPSGGGPLAGGADRARRAAARGGAGDERRVRPLPRTVRSSCSTRPARCGAASRRETAWALVVALQPRDEELLWLVTALDEEGLEAGVRALDERTLRDAYAVAAAGGGRVEKLPLPGP